MCAWPLVLMVSAMFYPCRCKGTCVLTRSHQWYQLCVILVAVRRPVCLVDRTNGISYVFMCYPCRSKGACVLTRSYQLYQLCAIFVALGDMCAWPLVPMVLAGLSLSPYGTCVLVRSHQWYQLCVILVALRWLVC